MPPCSLLSPTGFLASITLQSIPGFIPLTEVCLNPGLFYLALHTTLWSVRKMNSKPIFTAQYPIIDLAFNTYTLLTSSSSPHSSIFSNHIPIPHTSQLTTHAAHIPSIHGIRMPPQHSKPTRVHSNTISSSFRDITTIRKYQHLGETFFLMFFETVLHIAKHSSGTPSIGFHSYSQELVYMCSCNKFFCSLLT